MHPHDLPPEALAAALAASPTPDLLRILVETSRRNLGFYTRHRPHTINYPWVASRLEHLPSNSRCLDIGAGVTPLPIYLAQRGLQVDCVDDSDFSRTLPTEDNWNEWGFFDYSVIHPNAKSYNLSIVDFHPEENYSAIYSVSVLAHMTKAVRQETIGLCRKWLNPQGRLVTSIDLIAGTDNLWNRGGSDETPEVHGSREDVLNELRNVGFRIDECEVRRKVGSPNVDLFMLVATVP